MEEEGIIYKKEGRIATITINRPRKMNSITRQMGIDLNRIAAEVNDDEEVSVVILKGEGERAFSTGSDITMLDQYGSPYQLRNRQDYCTAIRNIRKPVIAAIKGYALGGGLELVLATDIRIASNTAVFAVSEVEHGWTSGSGATQLLARQIGYNRAAELVLTAKKIDAQEAYRLGIVNQVVAVDDVDSYIADLVAKMAEQSPIAMQLIKQNLRASQNMPQDMGLQYENDLFAFSFTTEDAAEGKRAFAEKRKPKF
ncbi:MAG: enoyl-CoA hydratase/isomerase family protein [Rikenellaceae bacterium]